MIHFSVSKKYIIQFSNINVQKRIVNEIDDYEKGPKSISNFEHRWYLICKFDQVIFQPSLFFKIPN